MAQINTFDPNQVEPEIPFAPIPSGDYPVMIVESEMQESSRAGNYFLKLVLQVVDGEFKGRKLFDRLNLVNSNPTAVEIANRRLSAICHATGMMQVVNDSTQLHSLPMLASVKVVEDPGYDPKNEITGYSAYRNNNQTMNAYGQPAMQATPPNVTAEQSPAPAGQFAGTPAGQAATPQQPTAQPTQFAQGNSGRPAWMK